MNYEKLREDAGRIGMDEAAKRAMTARLLAAEGKPKRAPVRRVLPAAAALLIAVGVGAVLWHSSANPPKVTSTVPGPTIAAPTEAGETASTSAEQTETGANDISAPPTEAFIEETLTAPIGEEPATQDESPVFQQGSANEATEENTVNDAPAGLGGNMWMLGPGETAPPMPTLIRSYPGYAPVKYDAPIGSYILSPALSAAIEKYGDDPMVHYYVKITVIDPNAGTSRTWDEWEALYMREIERMRASDVNGEFSILRTNQWDETTAVEFALYLRDPAFLENFPASPDYGYIIELFDEQSAVK